MGNNTFPWKNLQVITIGSKSPVTTMRIGKLKIHGHTIANEKAGDIILQTYRHGKVGIGNPQPSEKLEVDGNVKADGIILTSPNGTKYKIKVDNSGNLSTEAV